MHAVDALGGLRVMNDVRPDTLNISPPGYTTGDGDENRDRVWQRETAIEDDEGGHYEDDIFQG